MTLGHKKMSVLLWVLAVEQSVFLEEFNTFSC